MYTSCRHWVSSSGSFCLYVHRSPTGSATKESGIKRTWGSFKKKPAFTQLTRWRTPPKVGARGASPAAHPHPASVSEAASPGRSAPAARPAELRVRRGRQRSRPLRTGHDAPLPYLNREVSVRSGRDPSHVSGSHQAASVSPPQAGVRGQGLFLTRGQQVPLELLQLLGLGHLS